MYLFAHNCILFIYHYLIVLFFFFSLFFFVRNDACLLSDVFGAFADKRCVNHGVWIAKKQTLTFQIYSRGHRYQNDDHCHPEHRQQHLPDGNLRTVGRRKVRNALHKPPQRRYASVNDPLQTIVPEMIRSAPRAENTGVMLALLLNITSSEVSKVGQ